jgi:hypothetical protein
MKLGLTTVNTKNSCKEMQDQFQLTNMERIPKTPLSEPATLRDSMFSKEIEKSHKSVKFNMPEHFWGVVLNFLRVK